MKKVIDFIKESIEELKKVQWPSRKQTLRLTGLVILFSIVVALYVGGLDYVFKEIVSTILK